MRVMFMGSKSGTGVPSDVTSIFPFNAYVDERVGVVQAAFGGTATVTIEGQLNDAAGWTTITTISSADTSKAKTVALMPQMRINITAHTSGSVNCWLGI